MSKFLNYDDRLNIERYLKLSFSFGKIARLMDKDRTTISKEIKKYSFEKKSGGQGHPYNACKHRYTCKKTLICGKENCIRKSTQYCRMCPYCNTRCPDFEEDICVVKFNPPYVCNGCINLARCTLTKSVYSAYDAHIRASEILSECRTGILTNEEEIQHLNKIIMPLVKQGQSVHQIYVNNLNELMCSEKTIYNYIDAGILDVKNIDLPRKVRYRPRYKKPEFKIDRGCRINRNYLDFKNFIEEHPDTSIVQMDSVIGNVGGKVLLTIHFVDTSFMLAFLRDHNTSKSVIDVFSDLTDILGIKTMRKLFPVILTDNGSEFSNPNAIEHNGDLRVTNIFYCDPSAPYQKGAIEVNHELIRRVIPKGKNFNDLTQADVNRMMNHINSYKRKKLNDRSPYETFSFLHGEEVLSKMGCLRIAPENVTLTKAIFKK